MKTASWWAFLLNAFEMNEADFAPPALANPISVSRVHSAYARSNTLIITLTVTSNRPPAIVPSLPATATITDTIEAVSVLDFSSDPK